MTLKSGPIVILFGAGASYGAGGIWPRRPPLAKDLYGELAENMRAGGILHLMNAPNSNLRMDLS